MTDVIGSALVALVGVLLSGLVLALAASIPWAIGLATIVVARREGVPIVYNLRSLFQRRLTTSATAVGLVLVAFVLAAALMLAGGIRRTMATTGDPRVLKLMISGMPSEGLSDITQEQAQLLAAAPEAAADAVGPLVSAELVALTVAPRARSTTGDNTASLTVRGVTSATFRMRPKLEVEGRLFDAGNDEVVVGRALAGRFQGAQLGGTMNFAGRSWRVVGIADHAGSAYDSEVWADYHQMSPAFRRRHTVVNVMAKDEDAVRELIARVEHEPKLNNLTAHREVIYWSKLSESYVRFVTVLGLIVASLFSFGAILGAMNTMYAQVAARSREVGTLRSLGYKPRAILTSLVFESALLALLSGAVGAGLAALLLSGVRFNLTTTQTLSEISYSFHMTPTAALLCLTFSGVMGYAGGLLPALRAARMPLVNAIRAD